GGSAVSNDIIRHNNFDLDTEVSSSITMASDTTNLTIDGNRLNGGTYIIYVAGSGHEITNNVFGAYMFGSIDEVNTGAATYSGNIFGDTAASTSTASTATTTSTATSAAFAVTIDAVAPSAPKITSFSPDSGTVGDGITSSKVLTVNGTAEANST